MYNKAFFLFVFSDESRNKAEEKENAALLRYVFAVLFSLVAEFARERFFLSKTIQQLALLIAKSPITWIVLFPLLGFAQNCSLTISGYVTDSGTAERLEYVNILVNETKRGTVTDSTGFFKLTGICEGEYHLTLSHIGCESQQVFIHLHEDSTLDLTLDHSVNVLNGVEVKATSALKTSQTVATINEQSISDNASENLSNMLASITGVSTLKNGSGISKPVVQGLYGNRLTILNNGVAQSGQQWGNDHSPEIDPLIANKIRVIKGTAALEYMGSNLGNVILVEPKKIEREPHLHGSTRYFFESNGFSNGMNVQLQQYAPTIAWKVNATLKKSGDRKTATYYLNNTGNQEVNFALQLEKVFSERWSSSLYFSSFNTELGVLRGAHVGNLTDLETAFQQTIPFFTEDKFSYAIDAPKQQVQHHLLKLQSSYFIDDAQWFDFTFASQLNNRKEFDVRRGGRSSIPSLSLEQWSAFFEGKYHQTFKGDLKLKSGVQFNIIDNTNKPETGILPLIPDYLSYETGLYSLLSKQLKTSFFELGLRYDHALQNVVTISNSTPRTIIRYQNIFHNWSASGGWTYSWNPNFTLITNLGYAMRNPAVNELYSGGLHQGVSGIEEGNTSLVTEKSLKTTVGLQGKIKNKLSFEALFYYQGIADYIYLKPENEIRLTIRGAFPVFRYEQTNAAIYGLDFSTNYEISPALHAKVAYSFIKGDDLSNQLPLINMPANNIASSIVYEFASSISFAKAKLEHLTLDLNHQYVFQQNHLLPSQDFVLAPADYHLFGVKMATDIPFHKTRLRLVVKLDNLLNVAYRDYLNRQRYFADDLGINATIGMNLKF